MTTFDELARYLDMTTCDTTLKQTREFCQKRGLNFEKIRKELEIYSAYCDCEVLYNVLNRVDGNSILEDW